MNTIEGIYFNQNKDNDDYYLWADVTVLGISQKICGYSMYNLKDENFFPELKESLREQLENMNVDMSNFDEIYEIDIERRK